MLPNISLSSETLTPERNLPLPPVHPEDTSRAVSERGRRLLSHIENRTGFWGISTDYLIVSFDVLALQTGPLEQRLVADFVSSCGSTDSDEVASLSVGDSSAVRLLSQHLGCGSVFYLIPHTLAQDFARFLRLCNFAEKLPKPSSPSGTIPLSSVSDSVIWRCELQCAAIPDPLSDSGSRFVTVVFPVPHRNDWRKAICLDCPFARLQEDVLEVNFLNVDDLGLNSVEPLFSQALCSTREQARRTSKETLDRIEYLIFGGAEPERRSLLIVP
ncbi:MAG: hypothetical protein QXI19_13865 [Candidatus Caldarchaeum sp.]